jgi:glycosyltransferase involved in cell wall biosynthesis
MTSPLRVDIVVDNFNYGRFLADAIDSALAQTHPHTQVIVVDDGSTDDSRTIIESYGERIRPIFKPNGGQASALNAGFDRGEGEIVVFLDADDVLFPETAARVAAAFEERPDLAKLQYRMEVVDEHGQPTGEAMPAAHLPLRSGDLRRDELAFPFDLTWMATSGNAFARGALDRIMPIPDEQFARCADWYLQHLSALLGPVASADWIGARYRVHGANSYQLAHARLDLDHLHQSLTYAEATKREIARLADELGLERPDEILSVADTANRLVVARFERERGRFRLGAEGLRAARRRTDVTPAMRLAFYAWFAVICTAPRPLARRAAEVFLFPERRGGTGSGRDGRARPKGLNRWLARRHRP